MESHSLYLQVFDTLQPSREHWSLRIFSRSSRGIEVGVNKGNVRLPLPLSLFFHNTAMTVQYLVIARRVVSHIFRQIVQIMSDKYMCNRVAYVLEESR